MATVTITGGTGDAGALGDNRPWKLWAAVYQSDGTGGVITTRQDREANILRPVGGELTFEAEAGIAAYLETPEGRRYLVTIPDADASLWSLIEDSIPPTSIFESDAIGLRGRPVDDVQRDGVELAFYVRGAEVGRFDISDLVFNGNMDDIADGTTYKRFSGVEKAKLTAIEPLADVTDTANVDAAGAVMNTDTSTAVMAFVLDEDDMASNSPSKTVTQQSVRAYVLAKIAELIGAAPAELDTWIELVAAIQNNQSALAGINTALSGKQDISARLSGIAAATITTGGNRLLMTSDGGSTWTALSTTAIGRSLMFATDAAQVRTLAELVVGTNVQAYSAILGAIAGLTGAANDDIIQRKGGAFTNRTVAQLKADLTTSGMTVAVPVWFEVHSTYGPRAIGYGVNTMGFMVPEAFTLTGIIYRGETADASGSSTVEVRKNGTQITGSSKTITAANQWAYDSDVTITGLSVAMAAGDIIRPYISAAGTSPGNGFSAVLIGTKSAAVA